jgi:glycosyltransferase involved in cell wall biosynthesis
MKVLFDHQTFSMQKYGGISRYFANLNHGLNTMSGISSRIATLYSENEYLTNEPLLPGSLGAKLLPKDKDAQYKWNRRYSRWNVKAGNYDIFHPTYYDPYFIKHIRKPFVVTIHDMIYELYTELFDYTAQDIIARKKLLMDEAACIITISEHTKADILKFYPELQSKITVVPHGYSMGLSKSDTDLNLPERYILYVGDRWHYKNFQPFVKAISELLQNDTALKLICAGGGKFEEDELAIFKNLKIDRQCIQMSVTDCALMQLYSQARLFVFPSLQEGFGFPVLEAFANNCPVVCSNTTALPEVAGKAAVYFDPINLADIRQAVEQVLNNIALQADLKAKGKQQLALFTFDHCVKNTLKVYQSVL